MGTENLTASPTVHHRSRRALPGDETAEPFVTKSGAAGFHAACAAACIGLVACGGGADRGRAAAAETAVTAVRLRVDGSADSGEYEVVTRDRICARGLTGPSGWAVQYATGDSGRLRGIRLVVDDTGAAGGVTEAVHVGIAFGGFADARTLEIETRQGAAQPTGSAVARISSAGGAGTLLVNGRTADGVGITARVQCATAGRLIARDNAYSGGTK
jgi:hypothetical protein